MSEIKYRPYFSLNWQMRTQKFKKNLRDRLWTVYEHVDMVWTYQGAKIKVLIFMILVSLCRFGDSNHSCMPRKSETPGSNPTLAFKFQKNKMFILRSLVKIQYCRESPWPRGSALGLKPSGLEFRFVYVEGSAISFISPFSGGSPGLV